MKKIFVKIEGQKLVSHYLYKNYKVINRGYYPPDKCIWWEAINILTGEADHHATTKRQLKQFIDDEEN